MAGIVNEGSIQSAVFQLELGRGRRVVLWVLAAVGAIALGILYTASEFRGLEKAEAMDLAQLARNIARGDGFTTYVIRPLSLWHLKEYGPNHDQKFAQHPDLYNPPLYPLALAAIFRLLPEKVFAFPLGETVYAPERWVILPFNQVCLLLCLVLAYVWAKELFDRRVAITVGLLLLFSNTLWSYGVAGLPTTFLMLLMMLSLYCLYRADRRLHPTPATEGETEPAPRPLDGLSIGLILASGVLLGLCFLTRYTTAFFVLPMVIYVARILRGRRAALWAALYVVVFVAVITPWLVRNYQLSQSLTGIARYEITGSEGLQRAYKVEPNDLFLFKAMLSRIVASSRSQLFNSFKMMGEDFLMVFFLVGVMYGFRQREAIRLRGVIVGSLVCAVIASGVIILPEERVSPTVFGGNLFVLFLPVVAIYGVAFFFLLLDRIAFRMALTRALAIGVFALVNVVAIIYTLLPPFRSAFPYPPYLAPITRSVAHWFNADEAGVCDQPWSVAWYGDRRTVLLPNTVSEFIEIHDFVARAPHNVQFIFITPYSLDRPLQSELLRGQYKEWVALSRGQIPKDFPLQAGTLLPPETDQIILADKVRWPSKDTSSPDTSANTTKAPAANK